MKVLVTGAAGFVGRALCERLAMTGCQVVPAVRQTGGMSGERVVGDMDGETHWTPAVAGCQVLVHLAARVHVMREKEVAPLQAFRRTNRDGALNLARQAAAVGVRRFVFISTVKVLGELTQPGQPFTDSDALAPQDAYGVSKSEAEQGLWKIAEETGMEVVIVRPPLVYGPGVKANFASMMRWVSRGLPLPLGAVTHNRRSFIALDNLVDLIMVCTHHPAAANQTFLASDGDDLSTAELLRRMGRSLGKSISLPVIPIWCLEWCAQLVHKKDIYDRLCGSLQVDIRKTRQLLGWTPPLTVDQGLTLIAKEFRK